MSALGELRWQWVRAAMRHLKVEHVAEDGSDYYLGTVRESTRRSRRAPGSGLCRRRRSVILKLRDALAATAPEERTPATADEGRWECKHWPRCADAACSYNPALHAAAAAPTPSAPVPALHRRRVVERLTAALRVERDSLAAELAEVRADLTGTFIEGHAGIREGMAWALAERGRAEAAEAKVEAVRALLADARLRPDEVVYGDDLRAALGEQS